MKIMIKIAHCYTSPISSNDWESGTFSELAVKMYNSRKTHIFLVSFSLLKCKSIIS